MKSSPAISRKWLGVRIALYALGLLQGVAGPRLQQGAMDPPWLVAIAVMVSCPIAIILLTALRLAGSRATASWTPPTHPNNPFRLEHPLHFVHMTAHEAVRQGRLSSSTAPVAYSEAANDRALRRARPRG